ncbi:DUF4132 domain-containing protein [Sphingomonas sp.]|uniref:DUF4132 domain-containing protein n=1 Tax=Sphingomonas sp. TaxID=28214 RepID=UPI001DC4892C|nr:DUF4132 domain-containing protein [Sphingomonas sp.]MBX9796867.1 DUF4132 domain-containing protein [Sphingomonas sp.]
MPESIFDRIKRGFGLAGSAVAIGNFPLLNVARLFRHLEKSDKSLPANVARYIADGANSSLLSTLQRQSVRHAWTNRSMIWPRRDEENLFGDLGAWRIDQMYRFGEVLATIEPISYDWGYFGTKKSPDWLRHTVTIWLGHGRKNQPLESLVALAGHAGDSVTPTLDILFSRDAAEYASRNSEERFAGIAQWLERSRDDIVAVAPGLVADVRAELASAIGRYHLQERYLDLLIDLATGSSKKVRANARQALTTCNPGRLAAALDERFAKSPTAVRVELVGVASVGLGKEGHEMLGCWRQSETVLKVTAAIDNILAVTAGDPAAVPESEQEHRSPDGPAGYWAVDGSWVEAGMPSALPPQSPIPPDLLATLEPAITEFNRLLAAGKAQATGKRWHWSRDYSAKDKRDLTRLAQLAEGASPIQHQSAKPIVDWLLWHEFKHSAVDAFFNDPRLTLRHLARMAVALSNGQVSALSWGWGGTVGAITTVIQQRLARGADLRTFIALWEEAGGADFINGHLKNRYYWGLPQFDVPLWPLLCGKFDSIDQALGLIPQAHPEHKLTMPGLELLEYFPKLPVRYRAQLMSLGSDSAAGIRAKARQLLHKTAGIDAAISLQLQDGRQDVRALAAEWLASRGASAEAPAIRTALDKEKSDLARAAMITALNRLGEDVSAYFDPAVLQKEARAGLAKGLPKNLSWFPFDMLPALSWADGTPVDPVLPTWWVVLSAKLKQPGGNAMMNLWLDRLAPGQAHKLGWMVLTGWMDEDTRQPSDEEANAYASLHVDATVRQNLTYAKRWPDSAGYFSSDRAVVFAQLKRAKAGEYLGTAVDSKGILALAARVNGADAAQRIRPFLKEHGSRTSQAKAVLDVLAAIGDGAALQLILVAANRSKQRSVQAYAAKLVEKIADRNGWSPAELADRTVPTGGFDLDGTQELDLGTDRTYTLRLDAEDAIVILNADGREVKALPAARVDDEKPLVDAAKKQLSTARKEVKQVIAAQAGRLQEAMFLQRSWELSDWQNFVAGHPIVGRIAARLVWQGVDEQGAAIAAFRPLGDGSYTDCDDADVRLADFAQVRLAHSSLLTADQIDRWRKHLADYAVASPFDQLGRDLPALDATQAKDREIADRKGWMIETFKLRGIAGKLGYQRGPAEDGGWFVTYEKMFREAGLMVEIEFSGSPLPEENRLAAIMSLSFRKLRSGGPGGQVTLAEVPPVLLAESWRDLHDMADKGTGFDPDWKKKVH